MTNLGEFKGIPKLVCSICSSVVSCKFGGIFSQLGVISSSTTHGEAEFVGERI
jgi:hypothetical protein